MAPTAGLTLRKLADKSGDRLDDGSWPFAGLKIEGLVPETLRLSTTKVNEGIQQGWISVENERIVHRPSGPAATPWSTPPHTFLHCDTVTFNTVDGDVRYRVVHLPDKYVDERKHEPTDKVKPLVDPDNDLAPVTDEHYAAGQTEVHWFYDLVLEA